MCRLSVTLLIRHPVPSIRLVQHYCIYRCVAYIVIVCLSAYFAPRIDSSPPMLCTVRAGLSDTEDEDGPEDGLPAQAHEPREPSAQEQGGTGTPNQSTVSNPRPPLI